MRKVNQSGKKLHESDLDNFVNHARTIEDLTDLIEDENEEVRKKVNKKVDIKTPSYQDMHPYNNKF